MKMSFLAVILAFAGIAFSVIYAPGASPMVCLKACCTNSCGGGLWDTDGGFCHPIGVPTEACLACQSNCRAQVGSLPSGQDLLNGDNTTTTTVTTTVTVTGSGNKTTVTQTTDKTTSQSTTTKLPSTTSATGTGQLNISEIWKIGAAVLILIVLAIILLGIKV